MVVSVWCNSEQIWEKTLVSIWAPFTIYSHVLQKKKCTVSSARCRPSPISQDVPCCWYSLPDPHRALHGRQGDPRCWRDLIPAGDLCSDFGWRANIVFPFRLWFRLCSYRLLKEQSVFKFNRHKKLIEKAKQTGKPIISCLLCWSWMGGSNPRPHDYEKVFMLWYVFITITNFSYQLLTNAGK